MPAAEAEDLADALLILQLAEVVAGRLGGAPHFGIDAVQISRARAGGEQGGAEEGNRDFP
jgi:hypothetical protein